MEIVAPAGDEQKAKVALLYGADAIYIGAPTFGLRTFFQEMTIPKLKNIVHLYHQHGKKVFLTMNSMLHQEDEKKLDAFLDDIQELSIDACIVSEPGLLKKVVHRTGINCHVSTQASVTNAHEANFWQSLGARRVVLAREVSLKEASEIKKHSSVSLEVFIHGSMCVSYSGRCVISNYTFGRDANRGGCIQSCRYNYEFYNHLPEEEQEEPVWSGHFMNATDLMGVRHLPLYMKSGIDAVKIEGRRKSPLYVAQVVSTYKKSIQLCLQNRYSSQEIKNSEDKLSAIPSRGLQDGFLSQSLTQSDAKVNLSGEHEGQEDFAGIVIDKKDDQIYIQTSNRFNPEDHELFLIDPSGKRKKVGAQFMMDIQGRKQKGFMPSQIIRVPVFGKVEKNQVLARRWVQKSASSV